MVPTQSGQTNPLGQFISGSVPTPSGPPQPQPQLSPVTQQEVDSATNTLTKPQLRVLFDNYDNQNKPSNKSGKPAHVTQALASATINGVLNFLTTEMKTRGDTTLTNVYNDLINGSLTYTSQPSPQPQPQPSLPSLPSNQFYIDEINKLITKTDLMKLIRKIYSAGNDPSYDGWGNITVDELDKKFTKKTALAEIFNDLNSTGSDVEQELKKYYDIYAQGIKNNLSKTKAKAQAQSQVGFGNGLLNKKSQYKTGGNTKSKMARLKQLLKTL